jgi:hypothetical protein
MKSFPVIALLAFASLRAAVAQSPYQSSADFAKYAMRLREESLLQLEPQVVVPTNSTQPGMRGIYPWHTHINTTIFWVGEAPSQNNPVHNYSSSWDREWWRSFGGADSPDVKNRRRLPEGGTIPGSFIPQQNPFYFALPYNDVSGGRHKPEARKWIPWFNQVFEEEGKSVLRDRWIAIRRSMPDGSARVCYAQWADCGPFTTEHYQYVFGNDTEKPRANLNQGAGLDVSPAVRDYLDIGNLAIVEWKFVEFQDVPLGSWSRYGDNNPFVVEARRSQMRMVQGEKVVLPKEKPTKERESKEREGKDPRDKESLPLPKKDDGDPTVIIR